MAELGKLSDNDWAKTVGALCARAGITGGITAKPTVADNYLKTKYFPGIMDLNSDGVPDVCFYKTAPAEQVKGVTYINVSPVLSSGTICRYCRMIYMVSCTGWIMYPVSELITSIFIRCLIPICS